MTNMTAPLVRRIAAGRHASSAIRHGDGARVLPNGLAGSGLAVHACKSLARPHTSVLRRQRKRHQCWGVQVCMRVGGKPQRPAWRLLLLLLLLLLLCSRLGGG